MREASVSDSKLAELSLNAGRVLIRLDFTLITTDRNVTAIEIEVK